MQMLFYINITNEQQQQQQPASDADETTRSRSRSQAGSRSRGSGRGSGWGAVRASLGMLGRQMNTFRLRCRQREDTVLRHPFRSEISIAIDHGSATICVALMCFRLSGRQRGAGSGGGRWQAVGRGSNSVCNQHTYVLYGRVC